MLSCVYYSVKYTPFILGSSQSCWNFGSSGSSVWYVFSALCDLFITLSDALDPFSHPIPSIFWIPRILFTCGPVTVMWWWASFMGRARLANAGPGQRLSTPQRAAAAFVLLCWVSKCHDYWSSNFIIQWSCVPQSLLAGYHLSVFSRSMLCAISRLLNLGLFTNECLLLCERRFWDLLFLPPGTTFYLLCPFNVYGTVVERLMWHKLNKVFFFFFIILVLKMCLSGVEYKNFQWLG